MTKAHAIVHSISRPTSLPVETDNNNTSPTVSWYANPGTWMNMIVMAASASAIGATVAVAVHQFPPISSLENYTNNSDNVTTYVTRFLNATAAAIILQFASFNCNTSIDDVILAREHLICGQLRSPIFLIIYPEMILMKNGQNYDVKQTETKPKISFNQDEFARIPSIEKSPIYIVIMLDVDDSVNSPIQHWILAMNEKDFNQDVCSYKKPDNFSPAHRYAFLLYTTSLQNLNISNDLCNQMNKFPLKKIINDNQLKFLASIYFLSEKHLIPSFIDDDELP